ncbi:MAG: hypothetical protein JWN08_2549, partial [Frankiales bacterium]|nr:hypothetical protein [Frankiales bacterium]
MDLRGHVVGEPLGPVPHGQSFAATSVPDGAPVELEVLRVGDPFARVRLLSAADALRRCDGRGLVRVRQVVGPPGHGQGDDVVVVVRDRVDGPDLDTAPRPSPSAAVGLVADVLEALAVLHAVGQVHGALDGRAVRLDVSVPARPTPHLTGWGTSALLSGAARPADDVRDAGLLLDGLLGGEVPPALRDLLGALLSADPAARPDAATAATALRALDLD